MTIGGTKCGTKNYICTTNNTIMSHIKFFPNKKKGKASIYIRIRLGRKIDLKQSTGLTLEDCSKWNSDTQFAKGRSASIKKLNQRLRELRTVLEEEIDVAEKDAERSLTGLDRHWLKEVLLKFNNEEPVTETDYLTEYTKTYIERMRTGSYNRGNVKNKFSKHSIDKYQFFLNNLIEFEAHCRTKFKISDVNEGFADKLVKYLENTKGQAVNTVGRKIKRLKTIVKSAALDGVNVDPKFNLIKGFEDENIVTFLTFEEIEKLVSVKLSSPKLDQARDWFIISCYTALRISDLFRLRKRNIQMIDGGRYITFKQYKTKVLVEVPIHYHVENIINKYGGNFPPNASTNEKSNRAMLSKRIKAVCEQANINEVVEAKYSGIKGMYPKYKVICNHSGRRSFCSNFYGLEGWTTPMIMRISGHDNEKSFYKYIDKNDRTLTRQARALFDAMKDNSTQTATDAPLLRKVN